MTVRHFVALFALNLTLLSAQSVAGPGAVRGTVVDDSGKPVVGARVFVDQALTTILAAPVGSPVIAGPQANSATTDANGQFTAFLKSGNYVACAQIAATGLLDACQWKGSALPFSVKPGHTATNLQIVMDRGAVVTVHLNDPQQLLSQAKGPIDLSCRVQVVTPKGVHFDAAIVNRTSTGRDHAISVPFGSALSLQLACPHLAMSDGFGNAVSSAAMNNPGQTVMVPAAASPAALTFAVTGTQ